MAEVVDGKWVGKTSVEISGVKPDEIWPFLADFCSIHKWFPAVDECSYLEGTIGEVGVIRRCTTKMLAATDGAAEVTAYANEKLVKLDPAERSLSYQMLENNFGVPAGIYVGTVEVSESEGGCKLDWSFLCEPHDGWKLEFFFPIFEGNVKTAAERMEAAAKTSSAAA